MPSFFTFLTYFGTSVAYAWAFWALYVLTMGLYRAYLDKRLTGPTYVLGFPLFALAWCVDVLAQYTIATLLFWDFPANWSERMVTFRLKRYMAGPDGWRRKVAKFICDRLLDPFDPTGNHC
jgi:hypothetical protein